MIFRFRLDQLLLTGKEQRYLIDSPLGMQQIEGLYSPFIRFGLALTKTSDQEGFPLVLQELTYTKASSFLEKNIKLEPAVIQLSASSSGSLEPIWKPTIFKASRHWAYAFQWFGLAIVLIYLYVFFGYKQGKNKYER